MKRLEQEKSNLAEELNEMKMKLKELEQEKSKEDEELTKKKLNEVEEKPRMNSSERCVVTNRIIKHLEEVSMVNQEVSALVHMH